MFISVVSDHWTPFFFQNSDHNSGNIQVRFGLPAAESCCVYAVVTNGNGALFP